MRNTEEIVYPNARSLFPIKFEIPLDIVKFLAHLIGLPALAKVATATKGYNQLYKAYLQETKQKLTLDRTSSNDYAKYLFFSGKTPCEKYTTSKDLARLNGEKDTQFYLLLKQLYEAFDKATDNKLKALIQTTCEKLFKSFASHLSNKDILIAIKLKHLEMDLALIDHRPYIMDDPIARRLILISNYEKLREEAVSTSKHELVISSGLNAITILLNAPPKFKNDSEKKLYNDKLDKHKACFEKFTMSNQTKLAVI